LVPVLASVAVLCLLIWQVSFVNPTVLNRQNAAETSLTAIRGNITLFQDAIQRREKELSTNIVGLDRFLQTLESRLSDRMRTLPTTAHNAEDRDAVIARLDEQIVALQNSFESEIASLSTHRVDADITQLNRIEAIGVCQDSCRFFVCSAESVG